MKITVGKEKAIVRGIRPEENLWGPYQFPRVYDCDGGIIMSVHIDDDDIKAYGADCRWFKTTDKGKTWCEITEQQALNRGLLLKNGDRLSFPPMSSIELKDYKLTPHNLYTPDYDFSVRAEEGILPIPDGFSVWKGDFKIYAYDADRLPESISKKEWTAVRIPKGSNEPTEEKVPLEWNKLTHVVYHDTDDKFYLKTLFPRGNLKIGPDGALWITAFSGEGHLNPDNNQYSPYYSAELFRSDDNGHSFKQWAHMEYPADGNEYPYQSGGFSDSDIEFMPDGSMVWFMRSTWAATTGKEWDPMYFSKSTDNGKTWSKPKQFAPVGVLPRLAKLECGAVLLSYARPGMFISGTCDGVNWEDPIEVMTPNDRSSLHNLKIDTPTFWEWAGACNNPELVAVDYNKALLIYGDSYYPDETGVKRKTILCREITVEMD